MEGVGRQIDAGRQGAKRVRKEEFVQDTCRWKGGGGTLDPGTANNHRSAIGADEEAKTSGGGGDGTGVAIRQRPPPERKYCPRGGRAGGSSDWARRTVSKWKMGYEGQRYGTRKAKEVTSGWSGGKAGQRSGSTCHGGPL